MKKLIVILMLSMGIVAGALAQSANFENNTKVKDMRKTFYNKELLFTDAESSAFWPLFERFQKEEKSLKRKYKVDAKPNLSDDKAAADHIKRTFEFDQKKNELKKKYFDEFSKVLPVRKVALIEATERKFKREVLRKVRENRKKRNN